VLEQQQELLAQLDEAQANTPDDAPPDLDLLIDDYRNASSAIIAAGGTCRPPSGAAAGLPGHRGAPSLVELHQAAFDSWSSAVASTPVIPERPRKGRDHPERERDLVLGCRRAKTGRS
jgi:hypothetical protein